MSTATGARKLTVARLIAGGMLALWMVLGAASASAEIHHWLHSEGSLAHHECAINSLAKGQLLPCPAVTTAPSLPPLEISLCVESDSFFLPFRRGLLPLERGPPFTI